MRSSLYIGQIQGASENELIGFGKRTGGDRLGNSKLYLKIYHLNNDENALFFISVDALYISASVSIRLMKENGLSSEQVIFNATHTHSAPSLDETFAGRELSSVFLYSLAKQFSIGIKHCRDKLETAEIQHFQVDSLKTLHRRKIGRDIRSFFLEKKMIMKPNREKVVDNKTSVLFDQAHGLLLYSFACHPVFNTNNETSSDFIGGIDALLKHFDKRIKASIFLQGFCGDIRPDFTTKGFRALNYGVITFFKSAFNGEVFRSYNNDDFGVFCEENAQAIIDGLDCKTMTIKDDILRNEQSLFDIVSLSKETSKQLIVKIFKLGQVVWVSINAETLIDYRKLLTDEFPSYQFFTLGYADGMVGYLPSSDEYAAGGYEVTGSYMNYGFDSAISIESISNFEVELVKQVRDFLNR